MVLPVYTRKVNKVEVDLPGERGAPRSATTQRPLGALPWGWLLTRWLLPGTVLSPATHPSGVVVVLQVVWVPGAFELPVVARNMAATGKYAAVVTIGAVVS